MRQMTGLEILREKLKERGAASQLATALSKRLGHTVHRSQVNKWRHGRPVHGAAYLLALRDLLGIPIEAWAPESGPLPACEEKESA